MKMMAAQRPPDTSRYKSVDCVEFEDGNAHTHSDADQNVCDDHVRWLVRAKAQRSVYFSQLDVVRRSQLLKKDLLDGLPAEAQDDIISMQPQTRSSAARS
jgi:hypothetical protein